MTKEEVIKEIKENIKDLKAAEDRIGSEYTEGAVEACEYILNLVKRINEQKVHNNSKYT
jgi:L-lactate utilization protein LutB